MILNKSAFDENKKSFILNVIELENKSRQIEFLLKSKKVSGENAKRLFKSQIEINNFLKSLSAN